MAWQTPKTNWQENNALTPTDFNRIEGNIQHLQDTKETPAGAQAKVNTHAGSKQTHGISSGYYIAKTSRSDQLPAWNEVQGKPSNFPPSAHKSTHASGGSDALTPSDIGAETPAGAQAKAEAAAGAVQANLDAHKNVNATGAHKAKNIAIDDAGGHFTATDVEGALRELFTSVSNGKALIAGAITDKGVPTSPSDAFATMANKISQIPVGDYSIGDILPLSSIEYYPVCTWSFTGHTYPVYAVAVDNDGYVYSGSVDDTVRKISPSGTQVWSFTGHTGDIKAVAVDNNGYVYSGSIDKTVRKISPSGTQVWSFTGHTDWVNAVAVDNNGYVYGGSDDKTVRKISPSGTQVWSFTKHTDWVNAVAVDNDGYVYSGSADRSVRKINPSGTQVWSFTGHADDVNAVAVDNDGCVYSGSDDKTVRKISPSGTQVWSFTGHTDWVNAVAVDNNGYVYGGSYDRSVRKISPSGTQVWSFTGHTYPVYAVAVDNDGYVYSGSGDRSVRKILEGVKIIA